MRHIRVASNESSETDTTSPIPSTPGSVTLQIWDTAGQERFSSLSTAFFRGADAVILVFDVNKPESLQELSRWWDEFRVKVPIQEGREAEYCTVVVGNKMDLLPTTKKVGKEVVERRRADNFLREMIPSEVDDPIQGTIPARTDDPPKQGALEHVLLESPSSLSSPQSHEGLSTNRPSALPIQSLTRSATASASGNGSNEQDITPKLSQIKLRSDSSKFGTMNTSRTEVSVYHTPSSSLFHSRANSVSRTNSVSPTETATRARAATRLSRIQSQEFDMDLEDDFTQDVNTSHTSSSGGYATAKSMFTQSSSSSIPIADPLRPRNRPHAASILSESSLATVRPPLPTNNNSQSPFPLSDPLHSFPASGLPISPPRSRASTTSSTSSSAHPPTRDAAPATDLPTPSASPPSPPTLTASLISTMHQAQELQTAKLSGPKKLDKGPKLFFTSAKTGGLRFPGRLSGEDDGESMKVTPVAEIFDYLAERVMRRWEWEEQAGEPPDTQNDGDPGGSSGNRSSRGRAFTIKLSETWHGLVSGRPGCCSS
ncbi:hypothetical protein FRB95_012770 [Tulasnella sp. JGI-2019a]|nr:hypothetical protein FRB93_004729 [Tulasnella sp. JGI-2019a]KAG9039059.1 hypothetical protein FRB95_012770 [Tulasnella sp. JGI-2019a]